MEIDFDNLIRLQSIDEEIKSISRFLESLPSRLQAIELKEQESAQIVADARNRLSQNQKLRRDLEASVQDRRTQIAKYRGQLNSVKTNKEYTSLLKEIEGLETQIGAQEEDIISAMLDADDIEAEIKTAEKKAVTVREQLAGEKSVLQQEAEDKQTIKNRLQQERTSLIPAIPSDLLGLYSSIFRKNEGIALSPVTDDFCSMCQIRIRPQVLNELIGRKEVILCENCGRILYWKSKKEEPSLSL